MFLKVVSVRSRKRKAESEPSELQELTKAQVKAEVCSAEDAYKRGSNNADRKKAIGDMLTSLNNMVEEDRMLWIKDKFNTSKPMLAEIFLYKNDGTVDGAPIDCLIFELVSTSGTDTDVAREIAFFGLDLFDDQRIVESFLYGMNAEDVFSYIEHVRERKGDAAARNLLTQLKDYDVDKADEMGGAIEYCCFGDFKKLCLSVFID
jgi:hypothetical protein